jgi:hypothetical protein
MLTCMKILKSQKLQTIKNNNLVFNLNPMKLFFFHNVDYVYISKN